jgi:hypothetical protein
MYNQDGQKSQQGKPLSMKLIPLIAGIILLVGVIVTMLLVFLLREKSSVLVGEWNCTLSNAPDFVTINFEENGKFTEETNASRNGRDFAITNRGEFTITETNTDNADRKNTKSVSVRLNVLEYEVCMDDDCFIEEGEEVLVDYIFRDGNDNEFEVMTENEESVMVCRRR